jgi:hypothetical protein
MSFVNSFWAVIIKYFILNNTIFWGMKPCSPIKFTNFSDESFASIFNIDE